MSIGFNAEEIFQVAERIERNGARFYRRAAQGFTDSAGRQLLLDLVDMELEHERIFAEMRADFLDQDKPALVVDPYDGVVSYLRAIAGGHVFDVETDPSELLTGKETMEQILKTAIQLEEHSVVFYQGIRELFPDRLGRDRIDAIIKEEMKHITQLSSQLASLK